jgi:hypothetical protein
VCGVMGMCVHRVGDWGAGEWDHCPVERELQWTRWRGEGAAGEGCGRDGRACESVACRGPWAWDVSREAQGCAGQSSHFSFEAES